MSKNLLVDDLNNILLHTQSLWEELRNQRIFIAGGTGFFGCWLLESLAWANDRKNLNVKALVLSRNPENFLQKAPHLYKHPAIEFLKGNAKDFDFPEGDFTYLIHSSVYQQPADERPSSQSMANEMLDGTRHILNFCSQAKVEKMLLISTGAVYGKVPSHLRNIPEDFTDSIDPATSSSAYHHIRRMMESLTVLYAQENRFEAKIARCFSFIGPYMPLNGRFAASDFILDALSERPITVKGDGNTIRAYLYMADLAIWLWTILCRGINCRPYNVGSESPVTIHEMATKIANQFSPPLDVSVLGKSCDGAAQGYYVPDTARARSEIGLSQTVPLDTAIIKTMRWYRSQNI